MQILPIIKTQRQMAGPMTMSVWHLLTQRHRRCQSNARNQTCRLRRKDLHKVGAKTKAACVDAAAAYVGRGRGHPHRRRQDQMRDTLNKSFNATVLLQRGEGGRHMQEN